MKFPKPVEEVVDAFAKLPGIGRKTSQRLVQYLLKVSEQQVADFGAAVSSLRTEVSFCEQCFHITEKDQQHCAICLDEARDHSIICVVEEFIDVFAIENTREYKGVYHVLQGALSPLDGIGPYQLKMQELFKRIEEGNVSEIILATNPTMEGEATAMYIKKHIPEHHGIAITRIAKGIPMGGDIDYADEVTLGNSMRQRVAY